MTTDIAALIAEARNRASEWGHIENAPGDVRLLSDLADALEAAQVPATDDEREGLVESVGHVIAGGWRDDVDPYVLARQVVEAVPALAAAGFRRSSRVPVSRDELADVIQATLDDLHGIPQVRPAGSRVRALAKALDDEYDIFPKADRKPADSGEAGR